jgi:hypothetical protein
VGIGENEQAAPLQLPGQGSVSRQVRGVVPPLDGFEVRPEPSKPEPVKAQTCYKVCVSRCESVKVVVVWGKSPRDLPYPEEPMEKDDSSIGVDKLVVLYGQRTGY